MTSNPDAAKAIEVATSPTSDSESPRTKEGRKDVLFRAIQGRLQNKYPTRYLWDFYHDRQSTAADYGERLTLYNEKPIDNWMIFMQYYNNFPFANLRMKDAAHFFKHTVKPIWEDPRNQDGGAWHFRVPDNDAPMGNPQPHEEPLALQFFQQVLLATIGDDFGEIIQPRDDLCGVSITRRFHAYIVMIWTRRGDETKTINGIKDVIAAQAPATIKSTLQNPKNCYYKKHREHVGFDNVLAKRLMEEYASRKARNEVASPEHERPNKNDRLPF